MLIEQKMKEQQHKTFVLAIYLNNFSHLIFNSNSINTQKPINKQQSFWLTGIMEVIVLSNPYRA